MLSNCLAQDYITQNDMETFPSLKDEQRIGYISSLVVYFSGMHEGLCSIQHL